MLVLWLSPLPEFIVVCTSSSWAPFKEETFGKQCIYGWTDTPDIVDRKVGTSVEKIDKLSSTEVLEDLQEGLMCQMTGLFFLLSLLFGLIKQPLNNWARQWKGDGEIMPPLHLSRGNSHCYSIELISMVKSVEIEMEQLRPQPQLRQA